MSFHNDTHAYNLITALPGGVLREFRGQTDSSAALKPGTHRWESLRFITKRLNEPAVR